MLEMVSIGSNECVEMAIGEGVVDVLLKSMLYFGEEEGAELVMASWRELVV